MTNNNDSKNGKQGDTAMILTIDIGNTAITMGLFTPEGRLQFRGSLKTDKNKTRDQIAIDLLDMFHLYQSDLQGITGGGDLQRCAPHDQRHGRGRGAAQRRTAHDRRARGQDGDEHSG